MTQPNPIKQSNLPGFALGDWEDTEPVPAAPGPPVLLSAVAKGDIIAGDGSRVWQRFTAGTDGFVLTADSTQPYGVKWAPTAGGGFGGMLATIIVPVDSLHANPRAVTDWGPILNTQIALGPSQELVFGPWHYPASTSIDARNTVSIRFKSTSHYRWQGDSWANLDDASAIIWKGAGNAGAILYGGSNGFELEVAVLYDNSAGNFTGRLIDPVGGNPTAGARIRATLGSLGNAFTTASVIVSLDNVISSIVEDSTIFGATWGVKGREASYSNANQITKTMFVNCARAFIGNPWSQWEVGPNNIFEVGNTPHVLDDDFPGQVSPQVDFHDNGFWDVAVNTPLLNHSANHFANITYRNNKIFALHGPVYKFQGGGHKVTIIDEHVDTNDNSPIVDLGDTTAGAGTIDEVYIDRNTWQVNAGNDAVLHRAGHGTSRFHIGSAGSASHTLEERSNSGHESIAYPTDYSAPTVTALSLGTGGTVSITGTDKGFRIIGTAGTGGSGSGGSILRITWGTAPRLIPGSPGAMPNTQFNPQLYPAAALAEQYISDYNGTKVELGVANPIPAGQNFAYVVDNLFQ